MTYLDALIRLSPDDGTGIETLATRVIGDLPRQSDCYLQDNREHFEEVGASLKTWNKQSPADGAVLTRLRTHPLLHACRTSQSARLQMIGGTLSAPATTQGPASVQLNARWHAPAAWRCAFLCHG
ncbi:hypothetical protein [Xanthomonas campestris]|uniref:hypothetical protein n=1 Tax=Xanthomonas campestris TaxID=339 RepID=UPI00355691E5